MKNLKECCDNCIYYPRFSSDRDSKNHIFKCEKIDVKIEENEAINYICNEYSEKGYLKELRKYNFREVNNENKN